VLLAVELRHMHGEQCLLAVQNEGMLMRMVRDLGGAGPVIQVYHVTPPRRRTAAARAA